VAILHNLDYIEEKAGSEERLAHLAKQGFLTLPKQQRRQGFPPVERARVRDESVSERIVRERR
jgi:hypothetical protein